ncbi:hypothetical protein Tco_0978513 [Tanacetum coccineum]|uniref:Uncharacterized protein n=1 Tax=Tanacetum coccineum TaxID=301880 RepID=A0ABQ5EN24_9ASTR
MDLTNYEAPRVLVTCRSKLSLIKTRVKYIFGPYGLGRLPIERLTPDDNEARSEWWVSSRAYFDGVISVAERIPLHLNQQNVYEVPSEFYRDFEEQKRAMEEQKRAVEEMMKKDAERQETYDQGGPSAFRTEPNNSFFKGVPSYGQNMGY